MKKQLIPLFISLACATSSLLAEPASIYLQRFINLTAANAEDTTVGWSLYGSRNPLGSGTSEDGTLTNSNGGVGTQAGISGGTAVEVSFDQNDAGYIYMYDSIGANIMAVANASIDRSSQEVTSVNFYTRDQSGLTYTMYVAVQIGAQWYANANVVEAFQPVPAERIYPQRTWTWTAQNWLKLNFDPADAANIGLSADPAADLPSGNIENFGLYIVHPGPGSVVFDEFEVWAEASASWAGYPVDANGWVDTTPWLEFINVSAGDWVWVVNLGTYVYLPESSVGAGGAWAYVPK